MNLKDNEYLDAEDKEFLEIFYSFERWESGKHSYQKLAEIGLYLTEKVPYLGRDVSSHNYLSEFFVFLQFLISYNEEV